MQLFSPLFLLQVRVGYWQALRTQSPSHPDTYQYRPQNPLQSSPKLMISKLFASPSAQQIQCCKFILPTTSVSCTAEWRSLTSVHWHANASGVSDCIAVACLLTQSSRLCVPDTSLVMTAPLGTYLPLPRNLL